MRKEARQFDHIIGKLRPSDYEETWNTIEKYRLNDDVNIYLEDGTMIQTSRFKARELRKRPLTK